MKVPVNWLKDYVDIEIDSNKLGDALTLSGSKVEDVEVSGQEIQNVVTGKITKIEKHPDAEKLSICAVDIAKEEIQIVTAATNMKEQDIVPVALHGSTIHGGHKIKKGKLRGIVSQGMFCSEEELGLAEEGSCHGLMILAPDTPIGVDIKEVVSMGKSVIEFEITSNRPDCLSIVGIARETAATLGNTYRMPSLAYTCKSSENVNDIVKVEVNDPLCRRYMARGVKNVKIAPSPAWMQEKLEEAGVRSINNLVDITNYVMLELGQPMHAFDRRDIKGNTIIVERAKDGEKFITLDGEERTLSSEILTIRDSERAVGLAGIMGGLNSEVKEDTTEVVFEVANFEGTNIRVSSKELGIRTEASAKFEKDLDPNLTEIAINRACALVEELNCGEVMEGTIDIYENKVLPKTLEVCSKYINRFLGTNIDKEEMKRILDSLDMKTTINGDTLVIEVPTFRSDVNIKEDVAEEIVRIYGYNNVPSTVPSVTTEVSGKKDKHIYEDTIINALLASGLYQSINYSFVSPKVFDKVLIPQDSTLRKVVSIKNPLGEDYSIMRTTTIPSMMESLGRNYSRSNEEARLFEIGKIYIPSEESTKLPEEVKYLTIGMYGNVDYLNLKGIVENLLEVLGVKKATFARESENHSYHPGKTAKLLIGKEEIGVLGEVHPDVADNYEVEERAYVAQINIDALYKFINIEKKYKALPKFPAVSRDIAILVEDSVLVAEIEDTIRKQGGNMVEAVKLFDVYKGMQIPEGKKSIAYALTYRLENKTLTDDEVNKVHDKILKALEFKLGAELR